MKKANISTLLGFTFIIIGLVFSPALFGVNWLPSLLLAVFAGLACGIIFFVVYLKRGFRHWISLFPTCLFFAVAASAFLAAFGARGGLLTLPFLAAIGVPFMAAFLLEPRKNARALLPAALSSATVVGLSGLWIFNLSIFTPAVVIALGITFLSWYLLNTKKVWPLLALAVMVLGYLFLRVVFTGYSDFTISLGAISFAALATGLQLFFNWIEQTASRQLASPISSYARVLFKAIHSIALTISSMSQLLG